VASNDRMTHELVVVWSEGFVAYSRTFVHGFRNTAINFSRYDRVARLSFETVTSRIQRIACRDTGAFGPIDL